MKTAKKIEKGAKAMKNRGNFKQKLRKKDRNRKKDIV